MAFSCIYCKKAPVPGEIACQDRALHTEHLDADGLFSHRRHTGLYNAARPHLGQAIGARSPVKSALLAEHSVPAAGHDAVAGRIQAADQKVHLAAHHVVDQPLNPLRLAGVAGVGLVQGDHHLIEGDGHPAALVVHNGQAVPLHAAQCAAQDAVG